MPEAPNLVWSLDFMADRLADGRQFRLLNVLDDFNREALGTFRCPSSGSSGRLTRRRGNGPLDRFLILLHIEWRGKLLAIRVDKGPEYASGPTNERLNTGIGGVTPAMKLKMAALVLRSCPVKVGRITASVSASAPFCDERLMDSCKFTRRNLCCKAPESAASRVSPDFQCRRRNRAHPTILIPPSIYP